MEPAYVFSALMFHKSMGKLHYETKQRQNCLTLFQDSWKKLIHNGSVSYNFFFQFHFQSIDTNIFTA